jgi:hypothetical protein
MLVFAGTELKRLELSTEGDVMTVKADYEGKEVYDREKEVSTPATPARLDLMA